MPCWRDGQGAENSGENKSRESGGGEGAQLASSVERAALDLRAMSSCPLLGIEII